MKNRVAVVTGGNRGIGWEIVRKLARKGFLVVLAARNSAKGQMAAAEFQREDGLSVRFHELDVTSPTSIDALGFFLEKEFGRCDVLVNNAGIFLDIPPGKMDDVAGGLHTPPDLIRRSMETNTYGPLMLSQRLIPLMKKNGYGRIVNVSSGLGQLSEAGDGGKFLAYRMSKVALNMITVVLAAEVAQDPAGRNILINSCHPGWCRTDMGGPQAPHSPEDGAVTPVWLATLPDKGPTGGLFAGGKPLAW